MEGSTQPPRTDSVDGCQATVSDKPSPPGIYYSDYLHLDKLLDAQHPLSAAAGAPCHDEMLFIIVHQSYELWFRQMIHELRAVHQRLNSAMIPERELNTAVQRLARVEKIQQLLLQQLDILETMTPMDFLEFRDYLMPASGFQSMQFREIEILLGLSTRARKSVDAAVFTGRLKPQDQAHLVELEARPSLLALVDQWLSRMPFSRDNSTDEGSGYDFWQVYHDAVNAMLDREAGLIASNAAGLQPEAVLQQQARVKNSQENFAQLLDPKNYLQQLAKGERKLSHRAILNALFIFLYRDEPILQAPFRFLTLLMDIDSHFTQWRYRHAVMAQRMLGVKMGTGGSSGHDYLMASAQNNRIYGDLITLATYLLPRSALPPIPETVALKMGFTFDAAFK